MKLLREKTWVKVLAALLCILCLVTACLSGLGVGSLLYTGAYGGEDYFVRMAAPLLRSDAAHLEDIIYSAETGEDGTLTLPEYSPDKYLGENSNFIYFVTDNDGKTVLGTNYGENMIAATTWNYFIESYPTYVSSDTDYYLDEPFFFMGSTLYGLNVDDGGFEPIEDPVLIRSFENVPELPAQVTITGFDYYGSSYRYDSDFGGFYEGEAVGSKMESYNLTFGLRKGLPVQDRYRDLYNFTSQAVWYRYELIALLVVSLALGICLLVFLGWAVGHKAGTDGIVLNPIYRLPTDLGLVLCGALVCLPALLGIYSLDRLDSLSVAAVTCCVVLTIIITLCVYALMLLIARHKAGRLLRGTVIYWLGRLILRPLRVLGGLLRRIPLVWKTAVLYGILWVIGTLGLLLFRHDYDLLMVGWILWSGALGFGLIYLALCLRRLKAGAERIAAGDYTTTVKTNHLYGDFKDTADTLNNIRGGITAAVEDRLRSERLKTELITNVSHDLKTPLTSIVSYVDLLKQELTRAREVTPEAEDYLEVLDRQSGRMKKLIEDLVEASKASTGNLNLNLAPLDFTMLLKQALGEYTQKLEAAELTLISKIPEETVMVRADGQKLWRVFDNLLGNAVKYAMPGTRLYLTEEAGNRVTATFRNISREPLTISAEELLERFVRGDASRHTDGSGLGISIARSLTESMGGQFDLELDGDLFKVSVTFPVLQESEE